MSVYVCLHPRMSVYVYRCPFASTRPQLCILTHIVCDSRRLRSFLGRPRYTKYVRIRCSITTSGVCLSSSHRPAQSSGRSRPLPTAYIDHLAPLGCATNAPVHGLTAGQVITV